MGKRVTTVYIDDDLLIWAKSKEINVSQLINTTLQAMSNNEGNIIINKEDIDKKILEHQAQINMLKSEKIEAEKKNKFVITDVEY